jgi:hypothetical protein
VSATNAIKLWDLATGEAVMTLPGHVGQILGLACRPNATEFATTGIDQTARVWPTAVPSADTRREARIRARVEALYNHYLDKDRVAEDLRAERSLSEPDRAVALRLAAEVRDDPATLEPRAGRS